MRMTCHGLAILLLLLGIDHETGFSQPSPFGEWFTRAPLPTPRQEIPHAVLNGKIYVPGGFTGGGVGTNIVEVYDPAANFWATIPALPIAMHHLAFAAANGKLYVLGGYAGNSFSPSRRVFEFDFAGNAWSEKTPMPSARGAGVAAEFDGKIFVIGGVNSSGAVVGTNQMYDPAMDNWTTLASMPTPREHLAAATIDSLIYVAGGRDFSQGGNTAKLEAYSPTSNKWYTLANMPTARGGLAASALHGKLYVFGGEFPGVFSEAEEYDPATNSWRQVTSMPTPRHGMGAAAIADTIFIIGGGPVAGFGVSEVNSGFTISAPTRVDEESDVPRGYKLFQNYPNPFNAGTMIRFEVPRPSAVTLKIFDVSGREVATLWEGKVASGNHHVRWDATAMSGGLYFYQLRANHFVHAKKLVLLK